MRTVTQKIWGALTACGLIILLLLILSVGCGREPEEQAKSNTLELTLRTITRYVILVGVSDYPGNLNDLNYCVSDVTDMKSALQNSTEWTGATFVELTNSEATRLSVKDYFSLASTQLTNDGTLLFFFSGHGTNDGDIGYLVTYDGLTEAGATVASNMISENDLTEWLNLFPDSVNKIVITDACYSGKFIGKALPPNTKIKFLPMPNSDPFYKDSFIKDINVIYNLFAMTAAAGTETCVESALLENGAFTYYVVEGLGAGAVIGPADADASDTITCLESYNYASPLATVFNAGQHAKYYNGAGGLVIKQ